jgi:hypothetical protein
MLYVQRDSNGKVTGLTQTPSNETAEEASLSDPEVASFLSDSDFGLIRVIEDLIDVLVDKNIMNITDLPESAQLKLIYRKDTRSLLDGKKTTILSCDEETLF